MNPRHSLRKVLGIYEHENNAWLSDALTHVSQVLDIGANDGYFMFGCAAALERLGRRAQIIGFEPQAACVETLRNSIAIQTLRYVQVDILQTLVGGEIRDGMITLDSVCLPLKRHTLIKIDVEGAELSVIDGAESWMHSSNKWIIEVHKEHYLETIQTHFQSRGLTLVRVDQQPLPVLGRETRDIENYWLVSQTGQAGR
jgi:hypothetical protein